VSCCRAFLAGVLISLALLWSGCGGANKSDAGARPTFGGAQLGNDGRLIGDPSPLTVADLDRQPEASPQRAVMETLFWAQWGSTPNVLSMYDPRVRRSLGVNAASAYAFLRAQLVTSYPRVVAARKGRAGTFVGVEMFSKNTPVRRESFLLEKRGGDWRIVYDTLLDRALVAYIRIRVSGDPTAKKLDPRAAIQAESVARAYRAMSLPDSRAIRASTKPTGSKGSTGSTSGR
jgi:hypothetical protein